MSDVGEAIATLTRVAGMDNKRIEAIEKSLQLHEKILLDVVGATIDPTPEMEEHYNVLRDRQFASDES